MDTYSLLRQIADSWVLLAMFGFFIGTAIWAFLPSQSGARQDAAMIPFRTEETKAACTGTCASCVCATRSFNFEDKHHV
ncbi:Cbb3-type cytochrome oxidase component FixQ [Sulfitobacter sp. THAF37]|uniref:cbb3-type cytochrome c oxidase subunit 3 n=1 Tax=Sulfitobacter sp. THAF37 TaxID=2587855 RepID=UPI001267DEBC|nr:cbb3-type cytochrome c oxidase subunit 3 [Sulfitobacter sp. THAF37]QFT57668.1 Cbb3-type cytochrome oxidase component FixQ [Sulfitobacter sp. THAF37]